MVVQGSVLSPFLLIIVIDVVTELSMESVYSKVLYADDLFFMIETI